MVLNTAHKIMHDIVVPLPHGHKMPTDKKAADRERARLIFQDHPQLMQNRKIGSAEELVQKYWTDPHGELPRIPGEI
jgi:hypothetical protein